MPDRSVNQIMSGLLMHPFVFVNLFVLVEEAFAPAAATLKVPFVRYWSERIGSGIAAFSGE